MSACRNRADNPDRWPAADRADVTWTPDHGPTLLLWTDDGTRLRYPLPGPEAYRLVARLVGYLGQLQQPPQDLHAVTAERGDAE